MRNYYMTHGGGENYAIVNYKICLRWDKNEDEFLPHRWLIVVDGVGQWFYSLDDVIKRINDLTYTKSDITLFARVWVTDLKGMRSFLDPELISNELGNHYFVYKTIQFMNIQSHCLDEVTDKDLCEKVEELFKENEGRISYVNVSSQAQGRKNIKKELHDKNRIYVKDLHNLFKGLAFSCGEEYEIIDEATRGGYIRCQYPGWLCLENIQGIDATTMYWSMLAAEKYPMKLINVFDYMHEEDADDLANKDLIWFGYVRLQNVRKIDKGVLCIPSTYIKDKLSDGSDNKRTIRNGFVVECDEIRLAMSSIDYEIFKENYKFDAAFRRIYVYDTGYIPNIYMNLVFKYFIQKQENKNIDDDKYEEAKMIINPWHGGLAMRPYRYKKLKRDEIDWDLEAKEYNEQLEESLGPLIWYTCSTAYTRARVIRLAKRLGEYWLYSNTDSWYFILNDETKKIWEEACEEWNEKLAKAQEQRSSQYKVEDLMGLGILHNDGVYAKGIFLKAGSYCLEKFDTDKEGRPYLKLVTSGLSTSKVPLDPEDPECDKFEAKTERYMRLSGGIDNFQNGFYFPIGVCENKIRSYRTWEDGGGFIEEPTDFFVGDILKRHLYNK